MTGLRLSARSLAVALLFALAVLRAPEFARAEVKLPKNVAVQRDIPYGADKAAKFDLYLPKDLAGTSRPLPTVLWIHGGGWAGGGKEHVAQYAAELAAGGFAVAAMDYSLPPDAIYPTPVRQAFEALAYLRREAARLHVDPARFFIAGDSAGAQIAAQAAAAVTSRAYARRLRVRPTISARELKGALLYCGAYDLTTMGFTGPITSKLDTPLAQYAGTQTFRADRNFASFSVARYVTRAFPATFITAGNDDDFEDQSRAFARRLKAVRVRVDELFFAADFTPRQGHVYQFALDKPIARYSVMRAVDFMKAALGWR
ncbi:MAG: alpha/beta hydrolase [Methylobacteriaceae bacterium]|nr:alpha/beta hydrolase [Methylobacteriaceae bacterium]